MKAIRLRETNGTDALTYQEIPRPEPDADELLVRVRAAGVNPIDWLICRGTLTELLDEPLPWIPGWDVSGVVESVGTARTDIEPGDAVHGMVRLPGAGGTFAEYTTMSVEEVVPKPRSLSHVEAAAVPMVGQTAVHALSEVAGLESGQRLLIHAAAGGVGHLAVQLATHTGAHVIGTASGSNEAYLRRLGVDEFVNYREAYFEEVLDPVDVVLDAVGGEVLERSAEVVRPGGGVVVTLPSQPSAETVQRLRDEYGADVRFFSVTDETDPATLEEVTAHVRAGVVEPTVSETYSLSAAQTALDRSAAGHVRGKFVLSVGEGVDD